MKIYPNEYLDSVKEIKIDFLRDNNIEGMILDVDNTLINLDRVMPDGIDEWIKLLKTEGIKFCIVSNSNKEEKIKSVAEKLDIPYIFFAKKPFKSGFQKAKEMLNLKQENIAVVGDQIFTDILGANRCKMFSILVKPIEEKEYLITKIKRPIEKFVINQYIKKRKTR